MKTLNLIGLDKEKSKELVNQNCGGDGQCTNI